MTSVLVERRGQSAESVAIALETWAEPIGTKLGALLSSQLQPGESLDNPHLWPVLLARVLRASMGPLRAADALYEAEAADDGVPRNTRDAARTQLYDALTRGRRRPRA